MQGGSITPLEPVRSATSTSQPKSLSPSAVLEKIELLSFSQPISAMPPTHPQFDHSDYRLRSRDRADGGSRFQEAKSQEIRPEACGV